jgi:hypothetical protein
MSARSGPPQSAWRPASNPKQLPRHTDHRTHAEQNSAIAAYVRWRNARARPKVNFAAGSPIRTWTSYPAKAACQATSQSKERIVSQTEPGSLGFAMCPNSPRSTPRVCVTPVA